jgi:DNA (cytosine-5)-methyltransferase 1
VTRHDFIKESPAARSTRARTVKGVPTALGLFVGGGGLDLGFRTAGFELLAASDNDVEARRTHQLNWPEVPFVLGDVRTLTIDSLSAAMRGRRPDVIIGGPPCQGFSTLGDRLSSDPRNDLVDAFIRIVDGLRPQAVVIENVRAIATEYRGRYRDFILQRLQDIGYTSSFAVLNAADFGVPQLRRRAFFVAFSDPRISYSFPEPTHGDGLRPYVTVGETIMDLVDVGNDLPNHTPLKHTAKVVARYQHIPEGGMLPPPEDLPMEIRRSNFGSTYKRLHRERPSLTMVPGNNALPVHPTLDRSLTPREAARIQTFPDDHIFTGDRRKQCILVGNAVPPLLGRVLAESVWERILPLKGQAAKLSSLQPRVSTGSGSGSGSGRRSHHLRALPEADAPGFVDLFSGVGGFAVGLTRAGLRPLVSADFNAKVAKAHKENFPDVPFVEGDLSLPAVQDAVVAATGERPFVVVGGPPCQGFSVFGKRRMAASTGHDPRADPRNRLVFSFVDTVAKLRPEWVVMENVAGFASLDDGSFVEKVAQELRDVGYVNVEHRILDAADYGVPQHRKRFLMIGSRSGYVIPWPKRKFFANPKDWQKPFRNVGEAIGDLASEASYQSHSCHVPMNHRPLQVARYQRIPEGGRLDVEALPAELQKGYRTEKIKNFSHVFKRLHREKPSLTLVPGHNAFPVHPWLNRSLTVREAARLQTFPDDIVFVGAREDQCIQVGNAFPPLLAELLANNLVKAKANSWMPGSVPKLAQYSLLDLAANSDDGMAV